MHADRRRHLQIPFSRVVMLQSFIGEDAGRANLHEVAAELILQHAILLAAEIDLIAHAEHIEVASARIVAIKTHTTVTLDAAVHLVIDERAEILIVKRALLERVAAVVMAGHHRHVLQMTFAAFIAHRTIVRMVQHHAFDDRGAESDGFRILDRDARAFGGRRHARHHEFAVRVVFILELLDGALAAGAHRTQRGMPAEIRQIEPSERQACSNSASASTSYGLSVDVDRRHRSISRDTVSRECAARNRRGNISVRSAVAPPRRARARKMCALAPRIWFETPASPDRPGSPCALFHAPAVSVPPKEAAPARRAPAARLLRKEMFRFADHTDRTGLIVQHDHGAGTQPAAGLLDLA